MLLNPATGEYESEPEEEEVEVVGHEDHGEAESLILLICLPREECL